MARLRACGPESAPMIDLLLAFDDESSLAEPLALAVGCPLRWIERHRFPDGESNLKLPAQLPPRVALLRGLHRPNQKLAELMIDHNVGVSNRNLRLPSVDGDYFEQ